MRNRLCLVLLLSLASVCFAQVTSVPIIDEASLHSPLDNEGSVTLQRSIEGTSAEVTYSQNWIVRNISSKPILAVHEVVRPWTSLLRPLPTGTKLPSPIYSPRL